MDVTIRAWKLEDAEKLAGIINNKKVQDNVRDGIPFPYTVSDAIEYISAMLSADQNNTFSWAIVADDKIVGNIGVFRKDNVHRLIAERGYFIGEEYWGNQFATTAVKKCN